MDLRHDADFRQSPGFLTGRGPELAELWDAVQRLRLGTGGVVWIEGEPGIGKSSLVAAAAHVGRELGCQVSEGVADQLAHPPLLGVLLDCLEIRPRSTDPHRARIAEFLTDRRSVLDLADAGHAAAAVEMVVALVDELCTAGPMMLLVDDVQWADDASIDVCRRAGAPVVRVAVRREADRLLPTDMPHIPLLPPVTLRQPRV